MRVCWTVTADHMIDPAVNIDRLKAVGPIWGSWRTWRNCATDNVICHDRQRARELLDRAFQAVCNFYLPRSQYEFLQRPLGIKLYEGDYQQEVDDIEDIIALQLAAGSADIVLMLGYDLGKPPVKDDRFEQHKVVNRHGLIRSAISGSVQTQWVVIDHPNNLDNAYQNLPNLTCDTMQNALQLLV